MELDDGITCSLMLSKVMLQWLRATGVLSKTPTKKLLRGSESGVSSIISHSPGRQKGQPSRTSVSEPFNSERSVSCPLLHSFSVSLLAGLPLHLRVSLAWLGLPSLSLPPLACLFTSWCRWLLAPFLVARGNVPTWKPRA